MSSSELLDPFSTAQIRDLNSAPLPSDAIWDGFQFNHHLESRLLRLDESTLGSLPALKTDVLQLKLDDVPLQDLSRPSSTATSDSENDQFESLDGESVQGELVDLWILPDIQKRKGRGQLLNWDNFVDKSHQEPASSYLSETDPRVFIATLEAKDQTRPGCVRPGILLNAFFELCMGRDSVLFRWEEKDGIFVAQWQRLSARGYSSMLIQNCFDIFSTIGINTRYLMGSFQALDNNSPHLSSSKVTFLSTARSVLYSVHKYLTELRSSIMSLLQLKGIMAKVEIVVDVLKQCVDAMQANWTEHLIILSLMERVVRVSLDHPALAAVLQMMLSRTCRPILALLSEQIGLSSARGENSRGSFPETSLADNGVWEALLGSNFSRTISEAQKSLRLLRSYSPDCSILSTTVLESSPLRALEVGFTLAVISELQARAVAYEEAMWSLIASAESSTTSSSLDTPASESFDLEGPVSVQSESASAFRLQMDIFNYSARLSDEGKYDELEDQVVVYLEGQDFEDSPLQLDLEASLNLSITPLVSTQHRLLSYSVLRLLFQQHNLLGHLNLQKHFHLLGNAFFSSRLSIVLFDPDQNSGEGHRKTSAATGLRLHVRDSWPPAGSELRLVLMSILSDSLSLADRPLDDSMSFAIRDLPLEELEKCRDVDSIHALDFLRLHYTAPNEILEAVITPDILDKYDRIFQHLLRTLRIQAVAQRMLRESFSRQLDKTAINGFLDHKTVIAMHHFVSSIADYYHNTAIELNWRKFQAVLCAAKAHLDKTDYCQTLLVIKSLDHLRLLHERTLNKIIGALLLNRNQAGLRQMLEDIYGVILRSAAERRKHTNKDLGLKGDANLSSGPTTTDDTTTKRLHKEFRSKVTLFSEVLRVQAQSAEQLPKKKLLNELDADDDDDADVNMLEYLVLKSDMFGYWAS
ncbi:uncharacterized protein Z519_03410 [Cladophialophora bantiana CBS 173.52]|uniref:Spindle pole body component n=1 Tax=Cladophialophora bantiana (strain ATCC 10958 / CBS 173.52 / CDC B-1940 / NIH 8579) TaxID=1442370 RepID=A0A0D2F289_CLAB1|nr:uncharacterized protein Z519_03410 [Cladophialophora bantiana CBS 173.52]KIW96341.1 hypothetical protein Z519_03410 [Cladophialophora bantiana CBS 173.52]